MPKLGRKKDKQAQKEQEAKPTRHAGLQPATLAEWDAVYAEMDEAYAEMEQAAYDFLALIPALDTPLTKEIRAASEALSKLYRKHAQTERRWIAVGFRLSPEDRAVIERGWGPLFNPDGAANPIFHFWSQGDMMQAIAPYRRYHDLFP